MIKRSAFFTILCLALATLLAGDLWAGSDLRGKGRFAQSHAMKDRLARRFAADDRTLTRRMEQLAARMERRLRRSMRKTRSFRSKTPPRRLMRSKDKIRRYGLRQIRPVRVRLVKAYRSKPQAYRSKPKPRLSVAAGSLPRGAAPRVAPRVAWTRAGALPPDANGLREPILKYAKRFRVKPSLILAVIKNESDFDPSVVSAKGAHGLMQLVPESGGREAMSFLNGRETTPSAAYLRRPKANIELGTTYLHILQSRYFGAIQNPLSRRHAVIAAYNAGPSRVARAITGTPNLADAIRQINRMAPAQLYRRLLERLPHAETRVYLARVTRDLSRFSALDRFG